MNTGTAKLISAMVIGPVVCLLLIGLLASWTVIVLLTRRWESINKLLLKASTEAERSPLYCLLSGTLLSSLIFILCGAVLMRHRPFELLGILLLLCLSACVSAGSIIACRFIGDRFAEAGYVTVDPSGLKVGVSVLVTASLLPIAGWISAAAMLSLGIGALIKTIVFRDKRDQADSIFDPELLRGQPTHSAIDE